jgi:hypothetical protein
MKMSNVYRLAAIFLSVAFIYAFWKVLLIIIIAAFFVRVVYGAVAETSR